jgi:hypothetical protein
MFYTEVRQNSESVIESRLIMEGGGGERRAVRLKTAFIFNIIPSSKNYLPNG